MFGHPNSHMVLVGLGSAIFSVNATGKVQVGAEHAQLTTSLAIKIALIM